MRAEYFFLCSYGYPLLVPLHLSHPGEGNFANYDPLTKARQTNVVIDSGSTHLQTGRPVQILSTVQKPVHVFICMIIDDPMCQAH